MLAAGRVHAQYDMLVLEWWGLDSASKEKARPCQRLMEGFQRLDTVPGLIESKTHLRLDRHAGSLKNVGLEMVEGKAEG
jgi:hypothetical protein